MLPGNEGWEERERPWKSKLDFGEIFSMERVFKLWNCLEGFGVPIAGDVQPGHWAGNKDRAQLGLDARELFSSLDDSVIPCSVPTPCPSPLVSPGRQCPGHAVALGGGAPSAAAQPRAEGHVLTPPEGDNCDRRRKEEAVEHQPSFPGTAGVRWDFLGAAAARPWSVPPAMGEQRGAGTWRGHGGDMEGTCRDQGAIPTHALGQDSGEGGIFLPPRGEEYFSSGAFGGAERGGVPGGPSRPQEQPWVFLAECGVHCDVFGYHLVFWPFFWVTQEPFPGFGGSEVGKHNPRAPPALKQSPRGLPARL